MSDDKDQPYEPKHKGFDVESTRRAQETAERAREGAAAKGEGDSTYVDEGPKEAAERLRWPQAEVEETVEKANERGKKRQR